MDKFDENIPVVAKVVDRYTVVINKGSNQGIYEGDKFLIYGESDEEIIDPLTNKSLGTLEIVKGTGEVIIVQDEMSTIKSIDKSPPKREIIKPNINTMLFTPLLHGNREIIVPGKIKPFSNPKVKDKAKPI